MISDKDFWYFIVQTDFLLREVMEEVLDISIFFTLPKVLGLFGH